jgi:hypothetical protein
MVIAEETTCCSHERRPQTPNTTEHWKMGRKFEEALSVGKTSRLFAE